uniref:Uncharacterized protein n=1 Tax=Romanomermis culicivorax TaxID=13658 RepID=A0A915J428_ROMCU
MTPIAANNMSIQILGSVYLMIEVGTIKEMVMALVQESCAADIYWVVNPLKSEVTLYPSMCIGSVGCYVETERENFNANENGLWSINKEEPINDWLSQAVNLSSSDLTDTEKQLLLDPNIILENNKVRGSTRRVNKDANMAHEKPLSSIIIDLLLIFELSTKIKSDRTTRTKTMNNDF